MTASDASPHIPVLLDEVIAALAPQPGELFIDGTFGAGGYTKALLDTGAIVHAFDRDPTALDMAADWSELAESPPRLVLHRRPFADMADALAEEGILPDEIHPFFEGDGEAEASLQWSVQVNDVVPPGSVRLLHPQRFHGMEPCVTQP